MARFQTFAAIARAVAAPATIVITAVGGISVQPAPAGCCCSTVRPSPIQSSLSISTTPADSACETTSPTVSIASLFVTDAAESACETVTPSPVLGSISVSPRPATMAAWTTGPEDNPPPGLRAGDTYDRDLDKHAVYATTSHGDETHAPDSQGRGSQMQWSEIHDYSGDPTLGRRFADAMTKLEGLCYAIWGSRPRYDTTPKQQWYERIHPRCIWFAETWEQQAQDLYGDTYDYNPVNKEYAACGENPFGAPRPTVPKRSRSGDPVFQWLAKPHNSTLFPAGSVGRTAGTLVHDPRSNTTFGEVPDAGEGVTVSYTAQVGITYTSVTLQYQTMPVGGSWSGYTSTAMSLGAGVYTATIPAAAQGTACRWRIKVVCVDPSLGAVTRYDPDGPPADDVPADDEQYSFTWWTHYNPYEHGLPEMLNDYGPSHIDARKGQDWYLFDGSETIQPGLLTLARFTLDELVQGRSRSGRYAAMHHSPRLRNTSPGDCCQYMPIRWRWSGSAPHPHYLRGGKGGTPLAGGAVGVHPLHNAPFEKPPTGQTWGSQYARMTWRGIDMLYKDTDHFGNYYYGGGVSWENPPDEYELELNLSEGYPPKIYEKFPSVGLREGDVIDAVHIEEIIAAVDYLVTYGCWIVTPIYSTKRTPLSYLGHTCGFHRDSNLYSDGTLTAQEVYEYCEGCCDGCSGQRVITYFNGEVITDATDPGAHCDAFAAPSWADCWDGATHQKCWETFARNDSCTESGPSDTTPGTFTETTGEGTKCDEGPQNMCGHAERQTSCYETIPYSHTFACSTIVSGWSAYICAPPKCQGGPDSTHGNTLTKLRYDHDVPPNVNSSGTPGQDSQGNCFGDIKQCGEDHAVGTPTDLYFGELIGHQFDGAAAGVWADACECGDACDFTADTYPDVPGLASWREECCDSDGNIIDCDAPGALPCPICRLTAGETNSELTCNCSLLSQVCLGDAAYAAIDLNLDGSDRPYVAYAGRPASPLGTYTGDGVPYLRPYDLAIGSPPSSECPCETWTNIAECA